MFKHFSRAVVVGQIIVTVGCGADSGRGANLSSGPGAMAVVSVAISDRCPTPPPRRVTAVGVWVDGSYDQELLLFPGTGRTAYESLIGPLTNGRHHVELRPSDLWESAGCLSAGRVGAAAVEAGMPMHDLYRHAPVLELRADTVGEQTDAPLYAYAEQSRSAADTTWRYSVVFSNEDGGTPTRALLARWGRTTDIEQVYEITSSGGRTTREEFQGPDHVTRAFTGRRRGEAPILLVATMNNMVIDRGRGLAAVRPVPVVVDLARATRESTMDERPWAYRVMEEELASEGHIAADAPLDGEWPRLAPDPLSHVFLEARLKLDKTVAVAWVKDRNGRRLWSHYERMPLAIDRDGWVRSAVAVGTDPGDAVAEIGWACLAAPDQKPVGSCEIEATRAFVLTRDFRPGSNLVAPARFVLDAGGEARLGAAAPEPIGSRTPVP